MNLQSAGRGHPETHSKSSANPGEIQDTIIHYLKFTCGKSLQQATADDLCRAVSYAVREFLIDGMHNTSDRYIAAGAKRLYYLSMEFLLGRSLGNNLINLGIFETTRQALEQLGVDLDEIQNSETDATLGNGGLGRLAACFLDSLASLDMPGYGYGLNYEFGLFSQEIVDGYQQEKPNRWDSVKSPWLISRPAEACKIPIYGKIEHFEDRAGNYQPIWTDYTLIIGIPNDMPIVGYGGQTVNYLRLFSAQASDEFDAGIAQGDDYFQAIQQNLTNESVAKVLYPSYSADKGRELRLIQEYFLAACSIRDIISRFFRHNDDVSLFAKKVAIHLNDTQPALTIAELIRILVDEQDLDWEQAWEITHQTCAFTSHTLLPEALEKWPVQLLERVLPRHLQIIYEINHRFLNEVRHRFPEDENAPTRLSIIEEGGAKRVNMAHLAIVGSHSVNGVAALHSNLLRNSLFADLYGVWPERFNNKTNGITQRRWLLHANPLLATLISETIGSSWITNLSALKKLENFAGDPAFQQRFTAIKHANKEKLARLIFKQTGIVIDPATLFDVQIKRIHLYKRQLLKVLFIIHEYLSIIEDDYCPLTPRTHIFAGKAAPGQTMAKLIIKLISNVSMVINSDKRVKDQLKVILLPDYRVSLAEAIIPAADLSEQISTAGMEASGTGNMKLALNGALTIGTLDGATIEIMEEVGRENIFIFGLTAGRIEEMRTENSYLPWDYYANNPNIRRILDTLGSELFCQEEPQLFRPIFDSLTEHGDYYFHLADLQSYIDTQQQAGELFSNQQAWTEKAIVNLARIGKFSSDRTIRQYANEIWKLDSIR